MAKYTLDVTKRGRQFTIEGLHVGDNGFRTFVFCFIMGGAPFPLPEGCIATLFAYLPGGVTVYDSCTVLGDTVIYNLVGGVGSEASLTSVPGIAECEIRITSQSGEVLTGPKFSMLIDPVLQDDSAIEAQDSFTALTKTLQRVVETEQDVTDALEAASEAQNLAQNALSEAREAQENAESALEEAKESAGKVEGALERIENAETGLGSKVNKVDGNEGNVVVLGKSGGIADGGMKPSKVYVVPYYSPSTITETQKEEIRGIITEIAADKGEYALFMRVDAKVIPASFVVDRYKSVRATYHGNDSISYEISVSVAGAVTTSEEKVYVTEYDPAQVEVARGKPATAAIMAQYVQDYVAQHGGGVSDEVIAEAIEAYLKENPITITESDPTVPQWAKAAKKPSYTKSEVGLGNVDNVKQYSSSNPPPYPVTSVNSKTGAVELTAEQVGADAKGTAASAVSTHNTSNASHNDIRLLIEGLTTRLNTLANSTDEDLDQLSEIVAYIKSNKELIAGVTTNKVNVSDIINNLTTNVANKPLSAAQGVALKTLIDAITVPTKLSAFENDNGFITRTDMETYVDENILNGEW